MEQIKKEKFKKCIIALVFAFIFPLIFFFDGFSIRWNGKYEKG